MNTDYKNYFGDNVRNLLYLIIILIVIVILVYASNQTTMQQNNCKRIITNFPKYTITPMQTKDRFDDRNITNLFIKTAYNCCCSGKFKNDYVDICALQNCANFGVRALDFQIYKLNGKPIISASTVNEIKYKEMYNYLDFNDTMLKVYTYFIQSPPKTPNNKSEPLFLIFRVYSKAKDTYDQMFTTLNNIFGSGRQIGNMIFLTDDLTTATFGQLRNKVIILVEYSCIKTSYELQCKNAFNTSSFSNITALNLNGPASKIYRQSELLHNSANDYITWSNNHSNELNIIYPNIQTNSHNYDYILSGFSNRISFIGLNFQTNDSHLALLNKDDSVPGSSIKGFGSKAFKIKPDIPRSQNNDMSELITKFQNNVNRGNNILQSMINL
jgi:hypothetical protein